MLDDKESRGSVQTVESHEAVESLIPWASATIIQSVRDYLNSRATSRLITETAGSDDNVRI